MKSWRFRRRLYDRDTVRRRRPDGYSILALLWDLFVVAFLTVFLICLILGMLGVL